MATINTLEELKSEVKAFLNNYNLNQANPSLEVFIEFLVKILNMFFPKCSPNLDYWDCMRAVAEAGKEYVQESK